MAKLNVDFLLNNVPGGTPANARELKIIHEWNTPGGVNTGSDEDKISTNELDFVLQDADFLFNWKDSGLTGGPGMFEGPDYGIKLSDGTDTTILNFIIDLANNATFKTDCSVSAVLEKQQSLNWLEGMADSFSFAYLASLGTGVNGRITSADFVKVP